MRKKLSSLVVLGVIALLVASALPAWADTPQTDEGHWRYFTYVDDDKEAGCNTFLTTHEDSIFTGMFEGNAVSTDSRVVLHCSGAVSYKATLVFEEATDRRHDGRPGALRSGSRTVSGHALGGPMGHPERNR
jgi:hypothetical protein